MHRSLLVVALSAVTWFCAAGAHAKGDPAAAASAATLKAAIKATIDDQFTGFRNTKRTATVYTKDAMIAMTGGTVSPQVNQLTDADGKWTLFGPSKVGKHTVRELRVVLARDGASAWASFDVKVSVDGLAKTGVVDFRATELFVKGSAGWQVRAAAWSTAMSARALAKALKASKLARLETVFDQDLGDRDVLVAVKTFARDGLDATAATRTDLVAIGVASGERVLGGKLVAAKLAKNWAKTITLTGATWAATAGTTACATVNAEIQRGATTLPARLFVIFERAEGGNWSPVLVHLAAAPSA